MEETFWLYDNWVHRYAKIHRGDCTFCNAGTGVQANSDNVAGEWLGPFSDYGGALEVASRAGHPHSSCAFCSPSRGDGDSESGQLEDLEDNLSPDQYGAVIFTARWPRDGNWSGEVHHLFGNNTVPDLDAALDVVEAWAEMAAEGNLPGGPSTTIGLIHAWDWLGPVAPIAWHIPRIVHDALFDDESVPTRREDVDVEARRRMITGGPLATPSASVSGVVNKLLTYTGLQLELEGDFAPQRQ